MRRSVTIMGLAAAIACAAVVSSVVATAVTTVDVRHFGANGNGIVNDTAAFKRALTAGKKVLVPAGTYRVTHLRVPKGCSIVGVGSRSRITGSVVLGSGVLLQHLSLALAAPASGNAKASGYSVPAGTHDVVYDGCTFKATGAEDAALLINPGSASATNYDLTFRNCTFQSTNWNAVSVNDWSGNVHDITFDGCHVLTSGRMGMEITTQGINGKGMHNIEVLNCTFELCGWEPISIDGSNGAGHGILVDGCIIHGGCANDSWGGGGAFEINGASNVTFRNSVIYAPRQAAFNLNGGDSVQTDGWIFDNVTVDYARVALGTLANNFAVLMAAHNMQGAIVRNCTFNAGNSSNHAQWGVWLDNSSGNDFSGTTITGGVANELVLQSGSSSGNTLPTLTLTTSPTPART